MFICIRNSKLKAIFLVALGMMIANLAIAYDFTNCEKIQKSDYGVLNPSARALCGKFRAELQRDLINDYIKVGRDGFMKAREARFDMFMNLAIQAGALAQADRGKTLELLEDDKELSQVIIQGLALKPNEVVVPIITNTILDPAAELAKRLQDPLSTHNVEAYFKAIQIPKRATAKSAIRDSIVAFYKLDPSVVDIFNLIKFIGIDSPNDINLVIEIKYTARLYVRSADDLMSIFGEILDNGFKDEVYYEQNTLLFLGGALRDFIDRDNTNRQDFINIRGLIARVPLHPHYDGCHAQIISTLDRLTPRLADKIRGQVLKRFREKLVILYNQVKPRIEKKNKFQFYLLRPAEILRLQGEPIHQGECVICFDEFSQNEPGLKCPWSPDAYHLKDLAQQVSHNMNDHVYPTPCILNGHTHELFVTPKMLKDSDMEEKRIYDWELNILRAYHVELLMQQPGRRANNIPPTIICKTPDCGALLIYEDAGQHNNVTCAQCDVLLCYLCEHVAHPRQSCEEARTTGARPTYLSDLNSEIRPCPYCGTPIQKNGGCNALFCTVCNNEFNLELGAPREETPFGNVHTFHTAGPRQYLVEGDPGYVLGRESAYPMQQGNIKNNNEIRRGQNRYKF